MTRDMLYFFPKPSFLFSYITLKVIQFNVFSNKKSTHVIILVVVQRDNRVFISIHGEQLFFPPSNHHHQSRKKDTSKIRPYHVVYIRFAFFSAFSRRVANLLDLGRKKRNELKWGVVWVRYQLRMQHALSRWSLFPSCAHFFCEQRRIERLLEVYFCRCCCCYADFFYAPRRIIISHAVAGRADCKRHEVAYI